MITSTAIMVIGCIPSLGKLESRQGHNKEEEYINHAVLRESSKCAPGEGKKRDDSKDSLALYKR